MGMTIDEAIKHLERILVNEKENQFYVFSTTSISVAIETMRKYQKIEKYFEDNNIPQFVERGTCSKAEKDIWEILDGKID